MPMTNFLIGCTRILASLQRDGTVSGWYDRDINAGGRLDEEIQRELENTDIFLACASPNYIASNYCFDRELTAALEREERGEVAIVPVIFEPCDWLSTRLRKFKALPKDGRAISEFTNQNVAFLEVANELRRLAASLSRVPMGTPGDRRGCFWSAAQPEPVAIPRETRI